MGGACGEEAVVVDKVRLKRSIKSCSFEVLTGAGGSGKAKALLGIEVEAVGVYDVVTLALLTGAVASLVPGEAF